MKELNKMHMFVIAVGVLAGFPTSVEEAKRYSTKGYLHLTYNEDTGCYRLVVVNLTTNEEMDAFAYTAEEAWVKAEIMEERLKGLAKGMAWKELEYSKRDNELGAAINNILN